MRSILALSAVFALGCGRNHALTDGRYQLELTQTVRDDCSLSTQPDVVASGRLKTTGNVVRFDYDFLEIQLNGTYASQEERFSLDGSAANVQLRVEHNDCFLDLVTLHLDASTVEPTRFDGYLSYSLESARNQSCVCELWLGYVARLTEALND